MTGKPKYKPYRAKINPLPTTASVRLVAYAMTSAEIEPDEYFDYHNLHGMKGLGNRTIERLLPEFARLGWLWPERQECEGHYYSLDAAQLNLSEAWGHFQVHELGRKRSPTTIQNYEDYFKCYVLPKWGDTFIDKIETVAVEDWLDNLKRAPEKRWNRPPTDVEPKHLAPATRAKIRNQMSCVFSHPIRHKLYRQLNPITEVRTPCSMRQAPA